MSQVIDRLGFEGHDSELFSFLEPDYVEELKSHPSANTPLWTFGTTEPAALAEGSNVSDPASRVQPNSPTTEPMAGSATGQLMGVTYWNSRPSCMAFTDRPDVQQCEPHNGKPSEWHRYRGFTTNDPLIQVTALVLVRYFFFQGYTCALDDRQWIPKPADPGLDRLSFIRNWVPQRNSVKKVSGIWIDLKLAYFRWTFESLNQVPTALGVSKMSDLVDRCIGKAS